MSKFLPPPPDDLGEGGDEILPPPGDEILPPPGDDPISDTTPPTITNVVLSHNSISLSSSNHLKLSLLLLKFMILNRLLQMFI